MNNFFSRLTTRVSLAMVVVVVLSMAVIVRHWAFVTAPTLKAAEQTKAELLIAPYTQLLEVAVDEGNETQLAKILNQLVLLEDSVYKDPIVLSLTISLLDGRVIKRGNEIDRKATPFRAETPLFSPRTMELLGSVELEYNDAFYNRLIGEVWWEMGWSMGLALLLLLGMQYWVQGLLRPLTELSSRLANVDLDSQVNLPPAGRSMSNESRQVWGAVEQLFARLQQRNAALDKEHVAAQDALQAKLEAEAANKEKSQFLANMSHELRTPLNAIIGYSEMLYEEAGESGNAEMAGDLVRIVGSGKHLLSLINDVLDLSKIEAGKMQLYLDDVSLPMLVSEVMDNVDPLIASNGNSVTVNCDEKIGSIRADAAKLKQVLINVLGNAAKFTHNGEVGFSVERMSDKTGNWVIFRVVDTGIGVSEEQQKYLFKAFVQADESTTRQYGGTGLGLTISRSMCQLMGGEITVKSQPENGSEFAIKIPDDVGGVDKKTSVVNMPSQTPALNLKEKIKQTFMESVVDQSKDLFAILVIDDDLSVGDLLRRSLDAEDFRIEAIKNGQKGLERAAELVPDLIVLDVNILDMASWSVLSQLKKNPALIHIPVIMHSMTDERSTAAALGAADYVTKPAEKNELADAIKKHLEDNTAPTVLVIDGDVDARRLARMVFENEGWNTVECPDGDIGLMRVAEKEPAAIVLDFDSSVMGVVEFLQILELNEKWKSIPILVLTKSSIDEPERKELLVRVDMVIDKGAYSLDTMLRRLRELIGSSREESAAS